MSAEISQRTHWQAGQGKGRFPNERDTTLHHIPWGGSEDSEEVGHIGGGAVGKH